ncbi:MAG: hypothetical protein ABIN89_08450 [Chitinophagaceae bacterium]
MKKNISKETILQVCMQKQEELINNFNDRVMERRADASIANQSTSQSEDRNAGDAEVLDSLEKELVFAQLELSALKAINPTQKNTTVESGAVVVTNERIFFIAVSSEKVEIDGEVIYGISTNAPIYSVMQGLAKGDRFEFNGTAYDIEKVY